MLTGVVLAGGLSSRFGSDKARFEVDGVPMVLRVCQAMRDGGLDPVVVARDTRLESLGCRVLVEPPGPIHPLSGVLAVVGAAPLVMAPCDLPNVDGSVFRILAAQPDAAVAWDGERIHPLLGRIPQGWAERVRALRDGGKPARQLWQGQPRIRIAADLLTNVNRRTDLPT
jgi:molybdopterin-guanine dinucleotide biosynthesis protein A